MRTVLVVTAPFSRRIAAETEGGERTLREYVAGQVIEDTEDAKAVRKSHPSFVVARAAEPHNPDKPAKAAPAVSVDKS